jgi:GAF domain-containing protein
VGLSKDFLALFRVVTLGDDCACAQALQSRQRIVSRNVFADERFRALRGAFRKEGLVAVVSTPLLGRRGTVIGMLSAHFPRPHVPSAYALGQLDRPIRHVERIVQGIA